MNLKVVSLLFYSTFLNGLLCDDKLAFVFELVRHGARAPLRVTDPWIFKVPVGALTAQGMRHRLLLGMYNRQRFIE